MKNVLFCSYREWANQIYKTINKEYKSHINIENVNTQEELLKKLKQNSFDLLFFLGWSEIIEEDIVNNNFCICLHPSLLPLYRGGSPIQNQIINGEEISGVSLFKMDENIDTGPIIYQEKINIKDIDLEDIFKLITNSGIKGVDFILKKLINNEEIPLQPQDDNNATFFKRRNEKMSEILIEDFLKLSSKELHNKIRCLQDPYPNAFIRCKDGSILYLKKSSYSD